MREIIINAKKNEKHEKKLRNNEKRIIKKQIKILLDQKNVKKLNQRLFFIILQSRENCTIFQIPTILYEFFSFELLVHTPHISVCCFVFHSFILGSEREVGEGGGGG